MDQEKNTGLKLCFVAASIVTGYLAYGILAPERSYSDFAERYDEFNLSQFFWATGIGLSYPVIGAIVARFCMLLRKVAHLGKVEPRSHEGILFFALIWPVTLTVSLLVYPCLLLINVLF